MKTIILHGILAKKFGKRFKLDVQSAKEASHALACQIKGFKQFMLDSEKLGYRFAIFNGRIMNKRTNISTEQLDDITSSDTIHIMPKVIGSGGKAMGWLQVVVGAVMVVAGVMATNPALVGAGIGMVIGGVASLLMPTPKLDSQDDDGNRANNGFGGAVTTIAQGNPVPILYGEREIGGFIASAGIYAEDKLIQGSKVQVSSKLLGIGHRNKEKQ